MQEITISVSWQARQHYLQKFMHIIKKNAHFDSKMTFGRIRWQVSIFILIVQRSRHDSQLGKPLMRGEL